MIQIHDDLPFLNQKAPEGIWLIKNAAFVSQDLLKWLRTHSTYIWLWLHGLSKQGWQVVEQTWTWTATRNHPGSHVPIKTLTMSCDPGYGLVMRWVKYHSISSPRVLLFLCAFGFSMGFSHRHATGLSMEITTFSPGLKRQSSASRGDPEMLTPPNWIPQALPGPYPWHSLFWGILIFTKHAKQKGVYISPFSDTAIEDGG